MKILHSVARIFIDTFGITHPSEDERNRAARYIAFLLALVVVLLCTVVAAAVYVLHH